MKKRVFGRKFSRARKARGALLRSLLREFVLRGEITTTQSRAKYIKPVVDKLITQAKQNSLESRRAIYAFFAQDEKATFEVEKASKAFDGVSSGFTKFVKIGPRRGDHAPMVKLSWTRKLEEKEGKFEK